MKQSSLEDSRQKRICSDPVQHYDVSLCLVQVPYIVLFMQLVIILYLHCIINVCMVHRLTLFALLSECSCDEAIFISREAHKKF